MCFCLQAQDNWRKVFPTVSGNITDVYFWDELHGIIIGDDRGIGITYDGGTTWERIRDVNVNDYYFLEAINFINDTMGFIVGRNGSYIYKTTDGGNNWVSTSLVPSNTNEILFLNDQEGLILTSNNIYRTIDQGLNWSVVNITGSILGNFYGASFIDSLAGYTVGEAGQIAKTLDGGQNWNILSYNAGVDLKGVWRLNLDTAFAIGDNGVIVQTTDGINWANINSGTTKNLNNIGYFNDSTAIIIGDSGTILKSIDGGNNWIPIFSVTLANLANIYTVNDSVAYVVGSNSTILKTVDGGSTWISLQPFSPSTFESCITTQNGNTFAAGTEGSIFRSEDSGLNWQMLNTGITEHLYSVQFPTDSIGYAVGEQGTILKTTDKGDNWINQISNTSYNLTSVHFLDSQNGFAVGGQYGDLFSSIPDSSVFLSTIDGGATWTHQIDIINGVYRSVQFINPQFGYIVGSTSNFFTNKILKTTDGGNNWIDITSGIIPSTYSSGSLYSINIIDSNNAFIGGSGAILKTSNSGNTWTAIDLLNGEAVYDVKSLTLDTGYAVYLGRVLATTDGWTTYTAQTDGAGVGNRMRSVDFSTFSNGIAVGTNGSIFKYYENPCSVTNYSSYTYIDNGSGNYSFTNASSGYYNQSHWAFGDGNISTATNPSYSFSANGTFIVTLTINDSNSNCFDYYIDTITVTGVSNPLQCNSGFIMYPDKVTGDITIVNSSTGTNLTYLWNFGDGNTSTLQTPSHTYATAGPFYLCLTVDDGLGCVDMYCDSIGVNGVVFKAGGFTINIIGTPIITGLDNHLELNSDINIYPNPASNQLTIDTELKINNIKITNISGKIIKTITTDLNIVNVANLSDGIYFIQLITDERTITKKFVKQ
tara:strand:- start:92 stop:2716 length:2625 start_codon:yes stop_codon:yes gene_type:complete